MVIYSTVIIDVEGMLGWVLRWNTGGGGRHFFDLKLCVGVGGAVESLGALVIDSENGGRVCLQDQQILALTKPQATSLLGRLN